LVTAKVRLGGDKATNRGEFVFGERFGDRELFILLDARVFGTISEAAAEVTRLKSVVMGSILFP